MDNTTNVNKAAGAPSALNDGLERILLEVEAEYEREMHSEDRNMAREIARRAAIFERERCKKICEEKAHLELDYLRTSSAMTASELSREIGAL